MRIFWGLQRSRAVAAGLQSPYAVMLLRCLAVQNCVFSPAGVITTSNVSSATAARCTFRAPRRVSRFCKMLSCSWWESLAQTLAQTRRVAQEAIGERRELLRARDEWQTNRAIFKWQHSALSQRCRCASRRGTRAAPETPGGPPLHSFQPPASRGEGLHLGRARGRQPGNQGRREDARETPSTRQQKT